MEAEICDNCAYPAPLTEYEEYNYTDRVKYKFCEVCASTYLSRAITFPRQYGEQAALFQSLGWIANKILDEIQKMKENERAKENEPSGKAAGNL